MGILTILGRNAANGSRTRAPGDVVPYPEGFRGVLHHDASRCTGCGTCAYVCSPGAIATGPADGPVSGWAFAADRCAFCGRCAAHCPTQALDFTPTAPAASADRSAHAIAHQVFREPCAGCGRPVVPMPIAMLARLYADPPPGALLVRHRLCERCRRKAAATALTAGGRGRAEEGRE